MFTLKKRMMNNDFRRGTDEHCSADVNNITRNIHTVFCLQGTDTFRVIFSLSLKAGKHVQTAKSECLETFGDIMLMH